MKISLVIPTINHLNMLMDCIDSFIKYNGKEHEIIVVDDASPIELQVQIQHGCNARGVKFFNHTKNSGFSHTVNTGIRASTGDIVVLVNNDILFTQNVVEPILNSFHVDDRVGIVGALLFYPTMKIQHGGIFRVSQTGFSHRGWHHTLDQVPDLKKQRFLIGVTGALFCIRRETLNDLAIVHESGKKDYFNEEYFLASEDVEFCLRAWMKDWKVLYNPDIRAIHKEGETRGASDQEKMIKGRAWMIKEMQTKAKFDAWCKTLNFAELDAKVNRANAPAIVPTVSESGEEFSDSNQNIKARLALSSKDVPIIGIRRSGALGDVLLATPAIKKLKERYPKSDIWFATMSSEALALNQYVSKVGNRVEDIPSDVVFDLDLVYENNPNMNVAQAYALALLGEKLDEQDLALVFNSTEKDTQSTAMKLRGMNVMSDRIITVHMAQSWANRTWYHDRWMSVVRNYANRGFKVVVIGKGGDFRAADIPNVVSMNNLLSVYEIRELIKKSQCFVGMDSGMIHIAQSTKTPIVGIFTVADPRNRIVRNENTLCVVPEVECRYCLHRQPKPVTFVGCERKDHACLKEIEPKHIIAAVDALVRY